MKKSFRLLIGTLVLGAVVTATGIFHKLPCSAVGGDPVPLCPPGGCVIN
jgi:hypothetical protein